MMGIEEKISPAPWSEIKAEIEFIAEHAEHSTDSQSITWRNVIAVVDAAIKYVARVNKQYEGTPRPTFVSDLGYAETCLRDAVKRLEGKE